jgi:phage gp16-like protein
MSYFNMILMVVWASVMVVPVSMVSIAVWNWYHKMPRNFNEVEVDKEGNVIWK